MVFFLVLLGGFVVVLVGVVWLVFVDAVPQQVDAAAPAPGDGHHPRHAQPKAQEEQGPQLHLPGEDTQPQGGENGGGGAQDAGVGGGAVEQGDVLQDVV